MTFSHASGALMLEPSNQSLMETFNNGPPPPGAGDECAPAAGLSYREAPDGSVTMGTDPLSGQVVLIVQNGDDCWEIALPPRISRFASSEREASLAAAKQVAEAAFGVYWARREKT